MIRISSNLTFYIQDIVPYFFLIVVLKKYTFHLFENKSPDLDISSLLISICIGGFVYIAVKFYYSYLASEVTWNGYDRLYVKKGKKEVEIELQNINDMKYYDFWFVGFPRVELIFKKQTEFGKEILFIPSMFNNKEKFNEFIRFVENNS